MTIIAFGAFLWTPCRKKLVSLLIKALRVEEINAKLDRHMADDESKKDMYEHLNTEMHKLECEMERFIETDEEANRIYKEAHLVEIRDEIIKIYYEFINKGYIPMYDKENLVKRYELYEKLGGNSFVHDIFNDLMALPTESPSESLDKS